MRTVTWLVLGVVTLATLPVRGATEGFERYRIIMDRKPFGEPPPVVEPPPPPPEETPPWAEMYRLCSVYEAEGKKVRVGLLEMKSNKAMVLAVGEAKNGILLLSADVGQETAVLTKDGQEVTMKLESSKRRATPAKTAVQPAQASDRITPPNRRIPRPARGGVVRAPR